ncbi:small ribosomal subunit biogenesis GTPase RsgA [Halomonas sp. McH1-25]|uniref:small ribosomal subunit biogenesis GTPase RsgA n=1 Tax=unclassified Halomonas TaxID=2609666 RepID=UPI001EF6982D|nr:MULTISPECIES: small ribosomal subunit biogenesis GTPase RsgA [unclassified Halomonas]MCG7600343.1 small ribosomal subunit biogenesis GTPase RsgA [Halomonas sp. McH1-25]MCP1342519.1 small ribosomal subunit biogenesis GTPase RsgA [Halomonas sp. FL8]MCP1359544.1 small ribosomal subunit biogenesis GTPase RsgA [Halomonas sp. BBD45]
MSKRKLSRQQRWRVEKVQAERAARAEKQAAREDHALEAGEYGPEMPGRVIAHFGRTLDVQALDDTVNHRCHLRANLEGLVTGDRVIWRRAQDGSGVVVARDTRDNVLERPDPRGQLKPVAANIDQILIVFAAEPAPFANLIDRYLVAAEATGITPVLVLNKVDLLPGDGGELGVLLERYAALGYAVVRATTRTASGLDELHAKLRDKTSVFVGQSGVGKSSLIDRLLPDEALRIGALSEDSRKGTHTTTTARLYRLPAGGELIDSPGIREFGLTHLDERQVTEGFVEFRDVLGHCRFRDCRHRDEPGCALLEAVDRGDIAEQRFVSYRRILDSLKPT